MDMESCSQHKTFVFDTNVILHDSSCIDDLAEHDVVIPITVVEELDTFKKGDLDRNYHAREFARKIDAIIGSQKFNGGISLGDGRGKLMIKLEQRLHIDLHDHFPNPSKPDHQILNIAYHYAQDHPETHVILISKDVNFRMKAKAVGLDAEDYTKDHVHDVRLGHHVLHDCDPAKIEQLCARRDGVDISAFPCDADAIFPNEYFILRGGDKNALAVAVWQDERLRLHQVCKKDVYGIVPRNAEQTFVSHALCDPRLSLVYSVRQSRNRQNSFGNCLST